MMVQGDRGVRKQGIDSLGNALDGLISVLRENCFVRGFGVGMVSATVFWTLYLW